MERILAILPITACAFLLISLAGCAGKERPNVIQTPINIPLEKFQCDEPGPGPKGEAIMESDVAKYINSLEAANKDCKLRLKEIQIIVKCFNDPKCDMDTIISYMGLVKPTSAD